MSDYLIRDFADGRYPFRLGSGEVRELQRICDCGPMELHRRLLSGTWRLDDVTETIRLGLLGAARKGQAGEVRGEAIVARDVIAKRLVDEYVATYGAPFVDPDGEAAPAAGARSPWAYSALLAAEIVAAGLMGSKDEPIGKKQEGEAGNDPLSPTAASDGDRSSPPSPTGV